jgi:hypothetical protein
VQLDECPASYITPRSKEIHSAVLTARQMAQSGGAAWYGPNLSEWPAWAVDAMMAIQGESVAVEIACAERLAQGGQNTIED